MDLNAPILLIVFNRPETTQKVFDSIKLVKPKKLYVAADAPRLGNIDDEKNCQLVKEIVMQVDWDCDIHYQFATINQGCGPGPSNAITWAFKNEDRLVILEDDCVPALSFFQYCDELLERYKNDTRIWVISGNQYSEEAVNTTHSYFFARYCITWGWATWKRCWSEMDINLSKYPLLLKQDLFKSAFRTQEEAIIFQKEIEKIFHDNDLKSHIWDFQFGFAVISNGGLCIVPKKNLVSNIGYVGTHSNNKNEFHDKIVDNTFKIISHPDFILSDLNYDIYQFKNHWGKITSSKENILLRIIRKIKNIITNGK